MLVDVWKGLNLVSAIGSVASNFNWLLKVVVKVDTEPLKPTTDDAKDAEDADEVADDDKRTTEGAVSLIKASLIKGLLLLLLLLLLWLWVWLVSIGLQLIIPGLWLVLFESIIVL